MLMKIKIITITKIFLRIFSIKHFGVLEIFGFLPIKWYPLSSRI